MLREKVLAIILRNDVLRAAFFGSIARGEMTPESDVDILVEFAGRKSLMDLLGKENQALGGERRHNRLWDQAWLFVPNLLAALRKVIPTTSPFSRLIMTSSSVNSESSARLGFLKFT